MTLTHEQLAALVGTSRETVTKVLRQFGDRGLIRLARGRFRKDAVGRATIDLRVDR